MRFQKFIIEGYRAIKHTEVDVSNNLIPLIGINESGKTTVLQAILAFDEASDKAHRGAHLVYRNRYNRSENQKAVIVAEVIIESKQEIERLSKKLELEPEDPILKMLKKFQKEGTPLQLSRTFPGRKYRIENIDDLGLRPSANENLARGVYFLLPFILYFDDFSERVPEEIAFRLDPKDPGKFEPISISRSTVWHSLIEEIFVRNESSIKEFLTIKSEKDRHALIEDLQDDLNEKIVADWKQLIEKYGDDFAEESDSLQLQLSAHQDEERVSFEFQVKDRTNNASRFFNVTERSKGFQWFFNFTMKLKFNPKYLDTKDGAIYLLDEPGSYLHTSAQEELLLKLSDISKTNIILYCTHSQYLLDPNVINVAKIKIARKGGGEIDVVPFTSSGISEEHGALTPLYRALHMKVPHAVGASYEVITEGITDYYLFKLIQDYGADLIDEQIVFIPGSGAKQLSTLISFAITYSNDYRVLLDSDKEGREAYEIYHKQFGTEEIKRFFKYKLKNKSENVVLEDFFSAADAKRLLKLTATNDVKSAIVVLYYLDEKLKRDFISRIDKTTKGRLSISIGVINGVTK